MRRAALFAMLLTGCASMTREAILAEQAGYLANCPEKDVKVLSISRDRVHAEADVCGTIRRYQDLATYVGVDVNPRYEEIPSPGARVK